MLGASNSPDELAIERQRALRAVEDTLLASGHVDAGGSDLTQRFDPRPRPIDVALPSIDVSRRDGVSAELASLEEIGRGGMGVVLAAQQRSLGRRVALKTTISNDVSITRALLHEARVCGALEHPNILPIHQLGRDSDGAPLLVMKLVTGVTWSTLLAEPDHPAWQPLVAGHGDRIRANVEILVHLCRALSFAHDQGVVHRDLKPSNVMIGRFGEVYLLDWGAALRLVERSDEAPGIVGTPGYMAPELARGAPTEVEPQTDVYLLGAALYEVLAGRPPHVAPTVLSALASALLGEQPPDPEGAPPELIALVHASMKASLAERLPSAEAFRLQLERFLRRREAEQIVAAARASMRRAEHLLAVGGPTQPGVLEALVEARFGLGSALRARPDDEVVRAALDSCTTRMIERELDVGNPINARTFLAELSAPAPVLVQRVERAEAEQRATDEAARAHARAREDADASIGATPIRVVSVLSILIALPVGILTAYRSFTEGTGFLELAIADSTIVGIVVAGTLAFRRRVLATGGARRALTIAVAWCLGSAFSDLTTYLSGGAVHQASVHSLLMSAGVLSLGAVFFDRRLASLVAVNGLALAIGLAWPRGATLTITISLIVNLVLWVWVVRAHSEQSRVAVAPTPTR